MSNLLHRLLILVLLLSFGGQIVNAQEKVFFGNLHSHTSYSDGLGTPKQAYTYARDVAKLDFIALTEHNHLAAMGTDNIGIAANHALYNGSDPNSLISNANAFTKNDQFIALYGQEFSTISSGNHTNVFDIGEVIDVAKGRFDLLDIFLQANKDTSGQTAILMFNHPQNTADLLPTEYGLDDFGGDPVQWLNGMGKYARLIQMINGPGQSPGTNLNSARPDETAFRKFLNLGFKLAPTADQDNHQKNWGNATNAGTGIIATSLTKANLLDAMRKRHVYATEDKNLSVIIKVNGSLCGDIIAPLPPPGELSITYSINDADEPNADYEIQVWRDAVGDEPAKMVSAVTTSAGSGQVEDVAFSGEAQYFYFKIIQKDEDGNEDRAWTAPVWFQNASDPLESLTTDVGTGPSASEALFVASKKSEVYHISNECLDAKRIKPTNLVTGPDAKKGRRLHENCPRRGPN